MIELEEVPELHNTRLAYAISGNTFYGGDIESNHRFIPD